MTDQATDWPQENAVQAERPAWSTYRPHLLRLLLGFLGAPAAASIVGTGILLLAAIAASPGGSGAGDLLIQLGEACLGAFAVLTLPASLFLGVPLYALGVGKIRPRMRAAVLAGAGIGAIVNLVWIVLSSVTAGKSLLDPDALFVLSLFMPATTIGGGFGGAVFWLCAAWRDKALDFAVPAVAHGNPG